MAADPRAIPLSGLRELRLPLFRTSAVRIGLAVLLVALLGVAFLLVREDDAAPGSALIPGGDGGVVVLDLSASIGSTPHLRTERALRYIQDTHQPFGLVVFSDTAYELVPPGTASTEMRPFMRFFGNVRAYPCIRRGARPCPPGTVEVSPDLPPEEYQAMVDRATRRGNRLNPWSGSFRAGTRISRGLEVARQILRRDGMEGLGVLLISDLDDSLFDIPNLTQTLIAYRRDDIPLSVVGLHPNQDDREFFKRMLGADAFVTRPKLQRMRDSVVRERRGGSSIDFPWAIVGASALVLLLLALNEHVCGRLTWRRLVRGEETA